MLAGSRCPAAGHPMRRLHLQHMRGSATAGAALIVLAVLYPSRLHTARPGLQGYNYFNCRWHAEPQLPARGAGLPPPLPPLLLRRTLQLRRMSAAELLWRNDADSSRCTLSCLREPAIAAPRLQPVDEQGIDLVGQSACKCACRANYCMLSIEHGLIPLCGQANTRYDPVTITIFEK